MAVSSINIKIFADMKAFNSSMGRVNKRLAKMSTEWQSIGRKMSMALTLPLAAVGGLSFKVFADFENQMAKVKAVSGATDEEFKMLEKSARELGRTTQFTATQVGELQLNYSKLGFNPQEIDKVTAATLDLALATGEDLASSATTVAGVLNGFNLNAEESLRLTDVMAKSFSSSALDLEKFTVSMSNVGPIANQFGMSIEQTTAMLSALIDANIDASKAGTDMRMIFVKLAETGMTLQQAYDKINDSTDKITTAQEMFGQRAFASAIILAEQQEKVKDLTKEYNNAEGSARKMAATMEDTSQGSILRMKSAIEALQIEIGGLLAKYILPIIDKITTWAQKFKELDDSTKSNIIRISMLVAALGPAIFIMGKLIGFIRVIIAMFVKLPALIAGVRAAFIALNTIIAANPIGMFVSAITVAAVAIYGFSKKTKDASKAQDELKESIEGVNEALGNQLYNDLVVGLVRGEKGLYEFTGSMEKLKAKLKDLNKNELESLKAFLIAKIPEATRASINETDALTKAILDQDIIKYNNALNFVNGELVKFADNTKKAAEATTTIKTPSLGMQPMGAVGLKITDQTPLLNSQARAMNALRLESEKLGKASIQVGDKWLNMATMMKSSQEKANEAMAKLKEKGDAVGSAVGNVFQDMGNRIVDSLGLAQDGFGGFLSSMLKTVTQLMAMYLAQSMSAAIAGGSVAGAATGPAAIFTTPAFIATLVGGVLASFAAIPAFADGGLAYGPTMGMIGEYPGARSNPEVIAPLDKLKNIMASGTQQVQVQGIIKGNDIWLSNSRTNQKRDRI